MYSLNVGIWGKWKTEFGFVGIYVLILQIIYGFVMKDLIWLYFCNVAPWVLSWNSQVTLGMWHVKKYAHLFVYRII